MADILYAALAGSSTTSDLYTLDTSTGALTSIGPIGYAVTGLAWDPVGLVMYGATSFNSAADPFSLITIDKDTGAGTLVGPLSLSAGGCADICCRADGALFGTPNSIKKLVSINKVTGAGTPLASDIMANVPSGGGCSYTLGGVLYGFLASTVNNPCYWSINDSTGVGTPIGPVTGSPFVGAKFRAGSVDSADVFWALADFDLVTVNLGTGAITTLATVASTQVDAIVWVPAPPPTVTVRPATNVTAISATLQGTVNPNGIGVFAWFEYGLTTSYGTSTSPIYVGNGVAPIDISQMISGLSPSTTYHYRVGANQGTPPTGDTFQFTVNPKGVATTVYIDYGTEPKSLASTTAGTAIGSGTANVSGEIASPGLTANTVWFYRVRAVNAQGESVSNTQWIKTPGAGATRHVGSGQTYATINAALAAASGGDKIVVHAGSYGTVTPTQAFGSLVEIVRNGSDSVVIDNIQHNGAEQIYWGPGIVVTGASFPPSSGNHLIDLTGTDHIYFDQITSAYAGSATGDCSPLWATTDADNTFAMGSIFSGGGVMKGYTGNPGSPGGWPATARFLSCSFSGQSADIWHFDGMTDWFYEDCTFANPNPIPIPAEHHDGIQVAYGTTIQVDRCTFTWSGANQNGNNQGMILGDFAAQVAGCLVRNVLVNGWNGCSMNTQGAEVTYRNITTYHCKGVLGGSSTQQNEDFIMGGTGDEIDMMNVVAYKPYTNGGQTSITGNRNLIESGSSNITGFLTNTAFGTAQYVSPGSDFHPTLGGNLDRTGGTDGSTPLWDRDGRGYGPTMSKGCYAPTDVTTPLVVGAGYTP